MAQGDEQAIQNGIVVSSDNLNENNTCVNDVAREVEYKVNFRFVMTMLGFSMIFVSTELVGLLFATLLGVISSDLQAGNLTIWLFSSNLLATAAVAPIVGTLSDAFGRKTITLSGLLFSIIGMVVCARAFHAPEYIAGQVLTGIGNGVLSLSFLAAVVELVPMTKRGMTMAYIVSGLLPFTPGALYGQFIASYNWRWNAWFVAIWGFIAFIIITAFYEPPTRFIYEDSKRNKFGHVDFPGGILFLVGITLFLIAISWAGQTYPWRSSQVIAPLIIGLLLLVIFILWTRFRAKYSLFPRRLAISGRPFYATILMIFFASINYVPLLILWSIQSITVYNASSRENAIHVLPFGICILGGSILSAFLLSVLEGKFQLVMLSFCVMQTVGLGSMAAVDPENLNTVWGPLVISLIGIGGVLLPNQIVITILSPDDLIGTASALTVIIRAVGQILGLSIFYNEFLDVLAKRATTYLVPAAHLIGLDSADEIKHLLALLMTAPSKDIASTLPKLNTTGEYQSIIQASHQTFSHSFPLIYYTSIAFGASAFIACLFVGNISKFTKESSAPTSP